MLSLDINPTFLEKYRVKLKNDQRLYFKNKTINKTVLKN